MSVRCGYCGPGNAVPTGYDYLETRNNCLKKGFGGGAGGERRKWQRKLGLPIDPPFVSPCPKRDRNLISRVRRANRRRSRTRSRSSRSRTRSRSRSYARVRTPSRSRTRSRGRSYRR